jgi:choline dehydrogenase-like flavoprotein
MLQSFNALQAEFLEAITEALFHDVDMAIPPRQVVENLQYQFGLVTGSKPGQIALMIDALSVVLGGPFFLLQSPAERAAVIESRLQETRLDFLQDIARIRSIVYSGYYGHWQGRTQQDNVANPVHAQIGFTLPEFRDRSPPGEVPITFVPGRDLTHDDLLGQDALPDEVDVIVVGSGAGGAVAADSLAGYGHDVLILEAGPHYPSSRISHEERRMTSRLFVDGGIQSSIDNDFIVFQARCLGGGTVINNGIVLRMDEPHLSHPKAPDVFAKWHQVGAPVEKSVFDASYAAVEARLQVEKINPISGRNNGTHLIEGWKAYAATTGDPDDLAAPTAWFTKNYGPKSAGAECAYCGYCNTGCPYGRKHGMAQSYLIDAHRKGARIAAEARVTHIVWRDDDAGGKQVADGVQIVLADGRLRFVRARKGVVIAAGTMASSRILAASGIEGTGEGISLNIASPVPALMPEDRPVRAWDEDQMATYVDRGDFLIESHFQPPMSMSSLMPGWFGEHARRMQNYSRIASAGVLFPADRRGRLVGGKLSFKLQADVDLPLIRRALAALVRVHFAAGAIEVYPPVLSGLTIRPGDDIEAVLEDAIREADDVTLSSSHPHGGNAMNIDPANGVVDLDCRVHGTTNVLVTDASVLPSCIRVNAQLTTMAMAHYATARADPFAA